MEEIYSGWEASGQVGQEVYGAGIAFAILPRQYIKIDEDFLVFIDYPITKHNKKKNRLRSQLMEIEKRPAI